MKNKIILTSMAVVLFLCVVLSGIPAKLQNRTENVMSDLFEKYCVVLDAGHGGTDGGAVGITTKVREANINLAVTLRVSQLLNSTGIRTVLTRSEDKALCDDYNYSKKLDMQLRGRIISEAMPDVVVSIHMNSYPDTSVHGAQTFYYPDSEAGKTLAGFIQRSIVTHADPTNKRSIKGEDFFLLRTYAGPSALVECGFVTNPAEEKLLQQDDYLDKIAYGIFDGIVSYLMSCA